MITKEETRTTMTSTYEAVGGGRTRGKTMETTEQVIKTPLDVRVEHLSQREEALKTQDYHKLDENTYYRRFDEDESQRVKFVIFKNNRLRVIERTSNLSLDEEKYDGPIGNLEDILEYLN